MIIEIDNSEFRTRDKIDNEKIDYSAMIDSVTYSLVIINAEKIKDIREAITKSAAAVHNGEIQGLWTKNQIEPTE